MIRQERYSSKHQIRKMNDYAHGMKCKDYTLKEIEEQKSDSVDSSDHVSVYTLTYRKDLIPENMSADFVRGLVESYLSIDAVVFKVRFTVVKEMETCMDNWLSKHQLKFTKRPLVSIGTFAKHIVEYVFQNTESLDFLALIYESSTPETRMERPFSTFLSMCEDMPRKSLSTFHVTKKDSRAILPSKKRASDVGYDLTIISKVKDMGTHTALYDTGLIIQPPPGYYIEVVPRSSLSKSGYIQSNSIGIIDPNYLDTIKVPLTRVDSSLPELKLPFTGFQLIIRRPTHCLFKEVSADELVDTSRGTGGFGSTGSLNQHSTDKSEITLDVIQE
jgi:deoxyuridine 5'-triphosphate nucleotidohydrolase